MANILILNGPNLNLLGKREPKHYGRQSLQDIMEELEAYADDNRFLLQHFQSNAEHEIVERIHKTLHDGTDFIIINPAAFTHTSVAIRDALSAVEIPFIEVHLSNIHKREPFRQHSYFSDIAEGVIAGLGPVGYQLALFAAIEKLSKL
jgi:3-dehydroquinate dehydratase-2